MGKKTTILVTASVMIVVVVFFEFLVLRAPPQQMTSVDEIVSNSSAWLNRTVVVEGNLKGPFLLKSNPFGELLFLPWQYTLSSGGASIGVYWSTGVALNVSAVRVYGVVREVTWINPPNATIVYYINAEKVEIP